MPAVNPTWWTANARSLAPLSVVLTRSLIDQASILLRDVLDSRSQVPPLEMKLLARVLAMAAVIGTASCTARLKTASAKSPRHAASTRILQEDSDDVGLVFSDGSIASDSTVVTDVVDSLEEDDQVTGELRGGRHR